MEKYQPLDPLVYPRFCGVRTFMRLPFAQNLKGIDFLVAGVPFDTGSTFRVGARFAPSAIRNASITSGIDYGDLIVVPGYIEESYKKIKEQVIPILEKGIIPVLLGGDHSITLAHLRAVFEKYGPVALIHFDAHTDTWDNYFGQNYTHGTQFRRVVEEGLILVDNSIQAGMRGSIYSKEDYLNVKDLGYEILTANKIRKLGIEETAKIIKDRVNNKKVFFSFDIDFLDPAYAPGTSYPECGGFSSFEALELVRHLQELDFIGFDLVEVLPPYDSGEITSILASTIVFEFISLIACKFKERKRKKLN
ncbi:MAG: agmatinase [Armatimonadetes bacterium]|nr:agmatinase [Armatimonadota bacterium]